LPKAPRGKATGTGGVGLGLHLTQVGRGQWPPGNDVVDILLAQRLQGRDEATDTDVRKEFPPSLLRR
jgi:hypothetical protein